MQQSRDIRRGFVAFAKANSSKWRSRDKGYPAKLGRRQLKVVGNAGKEIRAIETKRCRAP